MTVIIKELIIKTTVIDNIHQNNTVIDITKVKNEIVKDCLHKLKKNTKQKIER